MEVVDEQTIYLVPSRFAEQDVVNLQAALRVEGVENLDVTLNNYDGQSHLELFLQALQTESLRSVRFTGNAAFPATLDLFLNAIQGNRNIRRLYLRLLQFPSMALSALLGAPDPSVQFLGVDECTVAAENQEGQWEDDFARAVNQNRSLTNFEIGNLDVSYLRPVLLQLGNRPTPLFLMFQKNVAVAERSAPSEETSFTVQWLLKNGNSRQLQIHIMCSGFAFNAETFEPIAEGIKHANAELKNGLVFFDCSFDNDSTVMFQTTFQSECNLRGLALCHPLEFAANESMSTIIPSFLRSDSRLESLFVYGLTDDAESRDTVTAIMTQLEVNTTLSYLFLDNVRGGIVRALIEGIPNLAGLQSLGCENLQLTTDMERREMLDALKGNHTIRSTRNVLDAFPDEEHRVELADWTYRNACIFNHLQNPTTLTLPVSSWPTVYSQCQSCRLPIGETIIYHVLKNRPLLFSQQEDHTQE